MQRFSNGNRNIARLQRVSCAVFDLVNRAVVYFTGSQCVSAYVRTIRWLIKQHSASCACATFPRPGFDPIPIQRSLVWLFVDLCLTAAILVVANSFVCWYTQITCCSGLGTDRCLFSIEIASRIAYSTKVYFSSVKTAIVNTIEDLCHTACSQMLSIYFSKSVFTPSCSHTI